ncbi:MAG: hypothetical protein CLLPBCKN_002897 [Chroococcidiopsis cubana SAG 39.79]|jgi:hypothetical protein|uniref:hypothetical protein n=1 Tax=Chroococcidiopsis TaxID=54298 RepID=UPI000D0595BF|nr:MULTISPECIES: hypothetical protein [Chroococcidiopsis]MBE9015725.1 hypothetical protein [Chroococcidiopsidales cyanobacterium LEGE 13417]PSB46065.1 hypothetical protein C7B80_14805 [Cyanosarcina cf. burmensis CCALA 770]MDZ4873501.1 hypothetical protein [Chroococcidiopsis cubana SAG 39.79]PSB66135.1 hypothetical protein C7B79_02420 [Chroococcidiopsis cubana CCALA 043]PSM50058.1 hypothetical protein C7Y66_05840 [Chroococcidiopsis sp. CCALA 051]
MLLILLLVGFLLIITIFAIALVWDYTHGIFSLNNTTGATAIDSSPNDPEKYILSQPIEHPTA